MKYEYIHCYICLYLVENNDYINFYITECCKLFQFFVPELIYKDLFSGICKGLIIKEEYKIKC